LLAGAFPLASAAPYAALLGIFHELERLHPSAAGGLLPQHAPWQADAFALTRLFAAVSGAVRAIAAETPLVLVVEDLHWADQSTWELVSFLASGVRADPVLLLVTIRAEELGPARPVSILVSELARMPHAERLILAPLDRGRGGRAGTGSNGGGPVCPGDGWTTAASGRQPILHRGVARRRPGLWHPAGVSR
jgi:hypothetical protein